MKSDGFFKNHADTLSIIGVNLVIAGILFTMCLSNMSRADSANNRFDAFMIAWKEESKDFHGRLCAIEERNKK